MNKDDSDIRMNETEKRELVLSKVILFLLSLAGLGLVIWLGWFAS